MECTKFPAQYHCEVELVDKLHKLANQEEEYKQNQIIAYTLAQCGKSLLGSYRLGETSEKLEPPRLNMISEYSD
jgi:hypothetical protein